MYSTNELETPRNIETHSRCLESVEVVQKWTSLCYVPRHDRSSLSSGRFRWASREWASATLLSRSTMRRGHQDRALAT